MNNIGTNFGVPMTIKEKSLGVTMPLGSLTPKVASHPSPSTSQQHRITITSFATTTSISLTLLHTYFLCDHNIYLTRPASHLLPLRPQHLSHSPCFTLTSFATTTSISLTLLHPYFLCDHNIYLTHPASPLLPLR